MLLLDDYEVTKVKHNKAQEKIKLNLMDVADVNQTVEDLKSEAQKMTSKYKILAFFLNSFIMSHLAIYNYISFYIIINHIVSRLLY